MNDFQQIHLFDIEFQLYSEFFFNIINPFEIMMSIRLDTEDDRTIASLRVNEPKFANFQKSTKNKSLFSRSAKTNVEDHHLLGELIKKYKSEKLTFNFIQKLSRTVPSRNVPDCI